MYSGTPQLQHLSLVIRAIKVTSCNRRRPTRTHRIQFACMISCWPARAWAISFTEHRQCSRCVTEYVPPLGPHQTHGEDLAQITKHFLVRLLIRKCVCMSSWAGRHLEDCRGRRGTRYRPRSRWPGRRPARHGPPPSCSASVRRRTPGWPPPHTGCTSSCWPARRSWRSAVSVESPWSETYWCQLHRVIRSEVEILIRASYSTKSGSRSMLNWLHNPGQHWLFIPRCLTRREKLSSFITSGTWTLIMCTRYISFTLSIY